MQNSCQTHILNDHRALRTGGQGTRDESVKNPDGFARFRPVAGGAGMWLMAGSGHPRTQHPGFISRSGSGRDHAALRSIPKRWSGCCSSVTASRSAPTVGCVGRLSLIWP